MESSIEIIYNVIKTEYEKNRNIKPIEEIITNEYINVLLDTYDNNKVIYCLKTLQNIDIEFEILDEDAGEEYNAVEEEEVDEEVDEDNLKTSIARDDNEYRELVKQRFGILPYHAENTYSAFEQSEIIFTNCIHTLGFKIVNVPEYSPLASNYEKHTSQNKPEYVTNENLNKTFIYKVGF